MSATQKTVRSLGQTNFDEDVNAAIALGYTDHSNDPQVIESQEGGPENDIYIRTLFNPGTNTPAITTSVVTLAFGNSPVGVPVVLPVTVVATNLTANITAVASVNGGVANPFTVGTNPMVKDIDGAVNAANNITFTPGAAGAVSGYLTLSSAGAQTIIVILTGTGT